MEDGGTRHLGHECRVDMMEEEGEPLTGGDGLTGAGVILIPKLPHVEFSLECRDLIGSGRDRKPNALVQVAVIDPREQYLVSHACTEIVEGSRDPLFLTGVTFPPEYPASPETLVKLTVYDVRDKARDNSSFLGSATFSVSDLLRSKDDQLTLNLRSSDGVLAVGTVLVSRVNMGEMEEGDMDHITADVQQAQKCTLVCESSQGTQNDKDNSPLTGAVFKNPVCKVYKFQTVDSKWMLVREQMEECTLSFSIPRQLLHLYIQEDMRRIQELRDLGELSPHWDNLRKEVIGRYGQVIAAYQETLAELNKITGPSFKPSCSKAQRYLEFIPINLHTQRMRVTCPRQTDAFYDVITVGAPAAHFQGFKGGGLQRLLSRHEAEKKSFSTAYQCIYYSPEHTAKAQEVLHSVGHLQPLISGLADQLLQAAQQHSMSGLREALKTLAGKTEQFVHALKDELVKSALLALHAAQPGYVTKNQNQTLPGHQGHSHQDHPSPSQRGQQGQSPPQNPGHSPGQPSATDSPVVVCNNVDGGSQTAPIREDGQAPLKRQDSIPCHKEYDEEEWDRVWADVAKSLNCVIAMVDKLQEQEPINNNQEQLIPKQVLADVITSHNPEGDWREQLCPLVVRLKECVAEVVVRARRAMTFVLLQEAACSIPQGLFLKQRRDVVFSQALAALACGFVMRLYAGMEDKGFLKQLHQVGLVAQFESLLSTYSEEIGMLEDMEVGISDLHRVAFKITQAKTDNPCDLQPVVIGRRDHYTVEVPLPRLAFQTLPHEIKEGKALQVYPVLFNVGINEQQTIADRFGDISLQERINQRNFEILDSYYKSLSDKVPSECLPCFQTQTDLKDLLGTLGQNVVTKKRKNVEILWLAGTICRRLNGIRFTSCKSAKDRTSMSVTLEQCALLRDEHQLNKDYFIRALDCMRSRLTQGEVVCQWDSDPEAACSVAENKPASRHFYPIALLLVSSHLLVVWLILSLVFLLAKYQ
ncbi:type II inositol 3,4-bisphosphate 4-phosphatase isoform X1 [Oncorhynchus mykiss]|uniref:type II inositol 3,4-bisphosphate 4-phosphatase isoform X1 n=2 Tax=Oncorhynchus mykiss TaxID=8022 RepID=UPI00187867C2|nr:type II inositol 3,4-bisphosphate 4-phosphatase isoform X1 [Oncorhynchus mykiss]XP_036810137.1 type II inositol 3,4-bisphosphate 4-phosphatase isoform X1 [Oncorhynchus mykiss]XP_036810138.1 type II inositol 3,4-bisphosphate 4-phosphatase isoform X1 [Oncorhynchus mykiss]